MLFTKKIRLGSETDSQVIDALGKVVTRLGGKIEEKKFYVVGSVEIIKYESCMNGRKLHIISETYEGLFIKGSRGLVQNVRQLVDQELAS